MRLTAHASSRSLQAEEGLNTGKFECAACMCEYDNIGDGILPPCGHVLCTPCFERFAKQTLAEKQMLDCPTCKDPIPGWLVSRALGEECGRAYTDIEALHFGTVAGLTLRQCPTADCNYRYELDGKLQALSDWPADQEVPEYRLFKCPSCERDICLKCNCQEHDGYTCAQYAAWKAENEAGEEKFGGLLAGGVVKLCPNCASPIEKNDGCNFITCQHCKCKEGFCWETGKPRFGPNGCGGGHNCH